MFTALTTRAQQGSWAGLAATALCPPAEQSPILRGPSESHTSQVASPDTRCSPTLLPSGSPEGPEAPWGRLPVSLVSVSPLPSPSHLQHRTPCWCHSVGAEGVRVTPLPPQTRGLALVNLPLSSPSGSGGPKRKPETQPWNSVVIPTARGQLTGAFAPSNPQFSHTRLSRLRHFRNRAARVWLESLSSLGRCFHNRCFSTEVIA